jgi:hypothetical protein
MADLNLSIAFSSDQQSIRQIQREINRALRDTSTQIDVSVNPNFFRNLTDTIQNLNVEIADLEVNQSAVEAIREQINRGIDIEITEIDVNQRALDDIQRRIEEVTTAIGIQGNIESDFEGARGKGAAPGLSGSIKKQTAQQATGAGLSLERDIVVQLEQRETLEKTLVQLTQGQVLLQRQINQKLNEGSDKLSTSLSERTFREATPQTRRFLLEVEELAQVTRGIAETLGLQDGIQKRVAREAQRQAKLTEEVNRLEQDVINGTADEKAAIRRSVRLREQAAQESVGGAESDIIAQQRQQNLNRLEAIRLGAENAIESAEAEADFARATEQGERQARSIGDRQRRLIARNNDIIERTNQIREDILSGDIRERDAQSQIRRTQRQGVQTGGVIDPNIARQQQDAQQEALASAQEALEGLKLLNALDKQAQEDKKARITAEKQATTELSRLDAQAQENRKAILTSELQAAKEAEDGERQARSIGDRQRRLVEQSERVIARINQIREEVAAGASDERDAQRELTRLRRQGLRTGGIVNPNVSRDLEQRQQEAVIAAQDVIDQTRQLAEEQAEAQQLANSRNAELSREIGFLQQAARIEQDLTNKRATTNQAVTRINRILSQVEDPSVQIFDEGTVGQIRGALQERLASLQELVANIDEEAASEKEALQQQQRAQRASERALKAERSAIESAVEIRQALSKGYIDAQQAARDVVRLLRRQSQAGDILDANLSRQLNDELQIQLRITQSAVKNKQSEEDAAKEAANTQKQIEAANRDNLNIAKRLNQIFLDQTGGRINTDQAG